MKNPAAVSIDVDTLSSIYKGQGLEHPGGYTFIELRSGLENIQQFFDKYRIKTTLFMVGNDFLLPSNQDAIRSIIKAGHEPANHSMTHPQGFRWLDSVKKREEIRSMGDICKSVTGIRPVGFRSPGWNIDDSTIPLLKDLGYQYDSSVFPTFLMPIMKFAHWASMSGQANPDRTTMGLWRYMAAPITPYRTSQTSLSLKGENGLIEFPVTVTPFLRLPFFATLLLKTGNKIYKTLYKNIKHAGLPVHFQMHLSDFVDYSLPELHDQVPPVRQGAYVPQALATSLKKKLQVFGIMMDLMTSDYNFITLSEWSREFIGEN